MNVSLFRWFNANDHWFRSLLFVFSSLPAQLLILDFYSESLGFNPFDALVSRTGFWSMFFLLLTLAITPLRRWLSFVCKLLKLRYGKRLADWNFLIKSRRMLGLYSFFYTSWHGVIYLDLELDWTFIWFAEDIQQRFFLKLGILAWLISFLLALTSPMRVRRKMGKYWRYLHRLMYVLCLLAVCHVLLEAKVGESSGLIYSLIVAILFIHRLTVYFIKRYHRSDDNGLEVTR